MELTNLNSDKKSRRKTSSLDLGTMMYGKVPPQAKDLEEAVLGAIMLEKNSFSKAYEILKPECFYVEANQRIFRVCAELDRKYQPIDLLTVVEELKSKEELDIVGGPYYVSKLTNSVVSAANIERHCRIILQKFVQREVIKMCGESIGDAYEDSTDIFNLLSDTENKIKGINKTISDTKKISIEKLAIEIISSLTDKVHNAKNNIENTKDIYTGMKEWDAVNGSLFNGVFTIAARPGVGKSNHMVQLICNMGKRTKVGIINAEMTNKQLMIRIGCNLKSINNYLWKRDGREITDDELKLVYEAMQEAMGLNIVLDDNNEIHKVVNKIKLWVEQDGVKVILIDILSKIKVSEEKKRYMTDVQEINYVLDQIDSCAKTFGVPIILYAHMNREVYKRGSKEPNLSDLKGSGNIEDFSYQVCFLHRPEYYDPNDTTDENGEDIKGLMYQIIAKHRDGELRRLKHKAVLECSQLKEWGLNNWQPYIGMKMKQDEEEPLPF